MKFAFLGHVDLSGFATLVRCRAELPRDTAADRPPQYACGGEYYALVTIVSYR